MAGPVDRADKPSVPTLDPRRTPASNPGSRRDRPNQIFMKPEVEIYDTTLRDGSQGEGINFSVADKLRIAERIDAFGIHYIEGGWPGSNPKDIEFFEQAKRRKWKHARLAAFGSTRRKGVAVADDAQVRLLIEAATTVVTLFGKTWLLHVKEVLHTTPDENLKMIGDTIRFLKDHGKFVVYDAEHAFDGFKDDSEGGGRVAAVMFGHHDREHGRRHRRLDRDDAFQFNRARQVFRQQKEEHRKNSQAQQATHHDKLCAAHAAKFMDVIGHRRADE
jgi:isopropylmalate/homocitrate/citramalate synthase